MVTTPINFIVTAFDPLRGDLASSTDTTLVLIISEVSATLDTSLVRITVDGLTVLNDSVFLGEYTIGSSIINLGGGDFQFTLVKATPWDAATRHEVRLFFPGE